ncbi:hypothetical protein [Frigoriglobus tundricola]|uniref:hypothetical protein n=1 Tax=Frigoriglobus tundricola TaxID=2774151 RepID=UPI00148EA3C7|nr:hypothetical protein [Frigoriglobus tundricola]
MRAASALATGLAAVLFVSGGWVLVKRVGLALHPDRAEQLANRSGAPDNGGWLLIGASTFASGRYLLPLAVGLSGAVAGERFRRTLDLLLSTTLDRAGCCGRSCKRRPSATPPSPRRRWPRWAWRSPRTAGCGSARRRR